MSYRMGIILGALMALCFLTHDSMAAAKIKKNKGKPKSTKSATETVRMQEPGFDLKQMMTLDPKEMERLIAQQLNLTEADNEKFYSNTARVFAETAMVHPRFAEREAAIKEIRGKLEQEDYISVIKRASDILLAKAKSTNAAEQATAMVALTNLVVEARALHSDDLIPMIQKIADADLQISDEARLYALGPVKGLISPSEEATQALAAR